jgi:DNA-directed RNA polymerase sigma subunit (sigma70/sigma32)
MYPPMTQAHCLAIDNINIAYLQAHRFARYGHLTFEDLLGEAQVALVFAANHFKPDRGFAFSTYATRCIIRRLVEALEREKEQQLPQDSDAFASEGDSAINKLADPVPALSLLEEEQIVRLKMLQPGVRFAVELRLGLWDGKEHKPEKIAFHLGLTVSHVMDLLSEGLDALLGTKWD